MYQKTSVRLANRQTLETEGSHDRKDRKDRKDKSKLKSTWWCLLCLDIQEGEVDFFLHLREVTRLCGLTEVVHPQ